MVPPPLSKKVRANEMSIDCEALTRTTAPEDVTPPMDPVVGLKQTHEVMLL